MVPPILLVRLKSCLPDGTVVGESDRVCQVVPVPGSGEVPPVRRAYCGEDFGPGSVELLEGVAGAPCEACLAKAPIPAFAILRRFRIDAPSALAESESDRADVAAWWGLGLEPEQKIAARFLLLVLLQQPARPVSIGEIAARLDEDPLTINLILLLHTAVRLEGGLQDTNPSGVFRVETGWTETSDPCQP